jgi:enoyl-CoA hydratase
MESTTTTSTSSVLSAAEGAVLWITLNRPDRLNAVNRELYDGLTVAVRLADRDATIRCVVVTGAGRAFCAGADLKAHADGAKPERERRRYARAAQRANRALQRCSRPVIAAVNGAAVGAGLELALSCDFIVVAEDAKLRLPELALGTFFGGGIAHTLPQRIGLARAKQLLFLGEFFTGSEAAALGLAYAAVPATAVPDAAKELAIRLGRLAPVPARLAKRLLDRAPLMRRSAVMRWEERALATCMGTHDWVEGIAAHREKREPRYIGE